MKLNEVTENEDGSVTLTITTTKEETEYLVSYAFLDILAKEIERMEDENNICTSVPD